MVVRELFAKLGLEIDEVGFEKAEALFEGLHAGLMKFGVAAAGAAAVGLAGLAKMTADAAVAANRLAQSTGLSLEAVQEIGFAAEASGVPVDEMAVALRHLAKTGVNDVQGEMMRLADQFKEMPDSGKKVELAMDKFGRAGARMIPFLNRGREGITELMEEAKALGVVLDKDDVAAGQEFKAALHALEASFRGLGYTIGRLVLPFFTKLLQGITHVILDMRTGAPWVRKLTAALKGLAVLVGGYLLTVLLANIGALAVLAVEYIAAGAAAVASGAAAVVAWVAAELPIIALTVLFAALILLLDDVWTAVQGGDSVIGKLFPEWLTNLRAIFKALGDIETTWKGLTGQMSGEDFYGKFLGLKPSGPPPSATNPNTPAPDSGLVGSLLNWIGAKPTFGGGASPAASVASSPNAKQTVNAPVTTNNITVNASPGMNEQEVANKVMTAIEEKNKSDVRQEAAEIE